MHPWITGRVVEERHRNRSRTAALRRRRQRRRERPPWFDRVVPAEAGPVRLRARARR